ncbi:MAG TPA: class I SAM-dependent methyltransferase [Flavisolibacter sp.]|nr:class I SAM-dependent methyltransferase [Flavisolibacter sp.]
MDENYAYPGQELELFEGARNWKRYLGSRLNPFIGKQVLEVGAGIGETTVHLLHEGVEQWTCLEPDETLLATLQKKKADGYLPSRCHVIGGNIRHLSPGEQFDTILYIDVLEHIEKDKEELEAATKLLCTGGRLIVLSPAFNFLYSEFDRAIGHYRRYRKKELAALRPPGLSREMLIYLDSMGFFASVMNKLLLHQAYPTKAQIGLWDRRLIPLSRLTDRLFFHGFGKSILAVWKKQ